MKKPKVVILIGDIGGGHRSPGTAIQEILKTHEINANLIDLFTYKTAKSKSIAEKIASYFFDKQASKETFETLSSNEFLRGINDLFWNTSNLPVLFEMLEVSVNSARFQEIVEIFEEEKPDIVISLHPGTNMILSNLKEKGFKFFYVSIITDLGSIHRAWAAKNADLIFSPTETATKTLKRYSIKENRIITGLYPTRLQFASPKPREVVLKSLDINPEKKVILITGGVAGIYSSIKSLKYLLKSNKYQVVIIAGGATKVKKELESKFAKNENVKILGYVESIQDIMNASDFIITKPGTNTLIELEVLNKKAIFTEFIGAQEIGNIAYLKKNKNFRYIGARMSSVDNKISELEDQELLTEPRRNVSEGFKIVEEILSNFSKSHR